MSFQADVRRERARAMRNKRPILPTLNVEYISIWLSNAFEICSEWAYADEEAKDALMDAMDGDDQEYNAYQMAFAALESDLEKFREDITDSCTMTGLCVTDCFDDFMVGIGGDGGDMGLYDDFEGDYYGLDDPWEKEAEIVEAERRIERMKKREIIDMSGACLRFALSYMALSYRLDALEAAVNILRSVNGDILQNINALNEQYDKVIADPYDRSANQKFKSLAAMLPDEVWIR